VEICLDEQEAALLPVGTEHGVHVKDPGGGYGAEPKTEAGRAFGYVKIHLPDTRQAVTRETFTFQVDKVKLREAQLRDGHYLLRTNLVAEDPAVLEKHK